MSPPHLCYLNRKRHTERFRTLAKTSKQITAIPLFFYAENKKKKAMSCSLKDLLQTDNEKLNYRQVVI